MAIEAGQFLTLIYIVIKYNTFQEILLLKQATFHYTVFLFMEIFKCIYLLSLTLKCLVNDLYLMSGLMIGDLTFPLKFTGTAKNTILQPIQLKCPDLFTSAIYVAELVGNRKHGFWLCFVIKLYVKMSQPVSFLFRCVFTTLTVNMKNEIDMKSKRNSKFSPFKSWDIINCPLLFKKETLFL